jgi:hypothetical protein
VGPTVELICGLPGKLLLALVSTSILASESRGTHSHVLPFHDSRRRATHSPFGSDAQNLCNRRTETLVVQPIGSLY